MIDDQLAEQAALYAVGAMTTDERELFETILEFHAELRAHASSLLEISAATALAHPPTSPQRPSQSVKARVLAAITDRAQTRGTGLVVAGPDRRVLWVNSAFSEMCGYSLAELEGQSLGPILQGEKTDRTVAERMRLAVHDHQPCHETILNYHKDGTPYWVEIDIQPFRDESGGVRWIVAREQELSDLALSA